MPDKNDLFKNLTSEDADILAQMMLEKLGPQLASGINKTLTNQNHFFRSLYISGLCKKSREEKNLSIKDISKKLKIPQYKLKFIEDSILDHIDPKIWKKYIDHLGLNSEFSEWLEKNRDVYEELGKK